MSDLIGKVLLNQFRVDAFVAAGGMGAVYKVWDLKRNVPLAMKVLHSDLAEDPSVFKRFQREGRALQKLAHPNIVPFYGLYQTMDFAFMLERFVDGPSLKDVIKRSKGNPLPIEDTLTYMKALCAALGYAHVNDVVHCDVKPGNVIIDRSGNIYLTDFGIARHAESTTTTMGAAGTPAYMPPEQILGQAVTPATDVYSLGVILYEMLTGQRPFRGAESGTEHSGATVNERIRYGHLHLPAPDPRELRPSIDEKMAKVALKALNKDPGERYANAPQFFDEICGAAGVSPVNVKEIVPTPDLSEKRDFTVGKQVIEGGAPEVKPANGQKKLVFGGVMLAGFMGFCMLVLVGVLVFGMRQDAKPVATSYQSRPTSVPVKTAVPSRTRPPATSTSDADLRTAKAILTKAAAVPTTRRPATAVPSKTRSKSVTGCLDVNSPARSGPSTSYELVWAQAGCYSFDARSSATHDSCGDIWLRIQAGLSNDAYLGNHWVCGRNVDITSGNVNTLPLINR